MNVKDKFNQILSEEEIMRVLDECYAKVINGVEKFSPSVEYMAIDYLDKKATKPEAVKSMLNNQIAKCTTSGFITGLGGALTLPVAVPANIGSVLYVQMRMIACTAYMAGYNIKSDQVQTLIYACLAGVSVNGVMKKTAIDVGQKLAVKMIEKIPGEVLTKINQKVGWLFITKFGQKGTINLGKLVPGVGAVVGGSFDLVETKIIADRAYKWFMENDFSDEEEKSNDDIIIDIDDYIDLDDENELDDDKEE